MSARKGDDLTLSMESCEPSVCDSMHTKAQSLSRFHSNTEMLGDMGNPRLLQYSNIERIKNYDGGNRCLTRDFRQIVSDYEDYAKKHSMMHYSDTCSPNAQLIHDSKSCLKKYLSSDSFWSPCDSNPSPLSVSSRASTACDGASTSSRNDSVSNTPMQTMRIQNRKIISEKLFSASLQRSVNDSLAESPASASPQNDAKCYDLACEMFSVDHSETIQYSQTQTIISSSSNPPPAFRKSSDTLLQLPVRSRSKTPFMASYLGSNCDVTNKGMMSQILRSESKDLTRDEDENMFTESSSKIGHIEPSRFTRKNGDNYADEEVSCFLLREVSENVTGFSVYPDRQRDIHNDYLMHCVTSEEQEPTFSEVPKIKNECLVLGEGRFGKVVLAKHRETGRLYGVKIFEKGRVGCNCRQEVAMYSRIGRHRNIVTAYDVYEDKERLYVVMELCEQKNLLDRIQEHGKLGETHAKHVFVQILQAIIHCHTHEVVHGDIKPDNILIVFENFTGTNIFNDNGAFLKWKETVEESSLFSISIKLVDFGSACRSVKGQMRGTSCGTFEYSAPEVLRNRYYVGHLADSWSLGATLYVILLASLPFHCQTVPSTVQKILSGDFHRDFHGWRNLTDRAKDLISRFLCVNPKSRISVSQAMHHPWICVVQKSLALNEDKDKNYMIREGKNENAGDWLY